MKSRDERELEELQRDVARRQQFARIPQPIGNAVSRLLSQRGYAHLEVAGERAAAWTNAVGQRMAAHTRVGNLRRGVLEIIVRNSVLMQELTFQKKSLLKQIGATLGESKIRDLRFRVDSIDP